MKFSQLLDSTPKWQHKDANVRLKAINTAELDADILLSLAKDDQDAEVQQAAITKLIDVDTLVKLCQDSSAEIQGFIVIRWAAWLLPPDMTTGLRDETAIASLGLLSVLIGIKVFGAGTVTFDRILGAITLYILIGVVWSEAYQLIGIYEFGAFAGIPPGDLPADRSTWIYFSFVTLTTVGYGDITPVAHAARALAILEALIGQLYPAIVLARLVSLYVAVDRSGKNQE